MRKPVAHDFFAGSGLVTLGLQPYFRVAWANDICPSKRAIYAANFDAAHFQLTSIENIHGRALPPADLSWASFPCQDLSLAGNLNGMTAGTRSGLFWQWLRVLDEMNEKPAVVCIENVVGFLVADKCRHVAAAYAALRARGYRAGAFVLDAVHFLPQSRPRSFVVGVRDGVALDGLIETTAPANTTGSVLTAHAAVNDSAWIWWRLPCPPQRHTYFIDLVEADAPAHSARDTRRLLTLLSERNREKLRTVIGQRRRIAGCGYKRTRREANGKCQRLELRFDGLAGCLRAPNGGSSRQTVLIVEDGAVRTRLLTVRETARLMGAPDSFDIPGSYTDGYRAMGDAVAVPVTHYIAKHLLAPLARRSLSAPASVAVSARGRMLPARVRRQSALS